MGLIVALALIVVAAGGGGTWWLLRGGADADKPGTTTIPGETVIKKTVIKKTVIKKTVVKKAPSGDAAIKQDAAKQDAARQDAARQDAARQDAARQDAARQGATRRVSTTTTVLSGALKRLLNQAESALKSKDFNRARHLGERLFRELPTKQRGLASAVLARAHCGNMNQIDAKSNYINVPRPLRRRVVTFCRRYIDFP